MFVIRKSKKCENPKRSLRWDAKDKGNHGGARDVGKSASKNAKNFAKKFSRDASTKRRVQDGPKPLLSNAVAEMGLRFSWAAHPGESGKVKVS